MDLTISSGEAAAKAAITLPIIDIAPWVEGHDLKCRLSTAAAIHAACLEFGFFYLDITSFVDPEEPEELSRLARDFFALPQDEKDKISLNNEDRARGSPQSQLSPSFDDLTPSDRVPEA
jgi:isopenicillin N synthase-like dioxygenase